ncbi:MAG: polynucleotide adenylyltransferase, partial [Acidimicrobiia bacterium]
MTSEPFAEDNLRDLREAQLIARFRLEPAPETVELCRTLTPDHLSRERVFEEFTKLLLRGAAPSLGLRFLEHIGWLRFWPELETMIGVEQDPVWHPEGDVWTHTLHCLDAFAARRTGDDNEADLIVGLAVLCHDLGKPPTTEFRDGRWRSWGHDDAGEAPARSFLARLTNSDDLVDAVAAL